MKGFFKPKNPSKYKGDPTKIVYRSSWELKVMGYLDDHDEVIWWQSEELWIKYKSPADKKYHRYFVDFVCKLKSGDGTKTILIEVKPKSQTMPPKKPTKITKSYIRDVLTYGINEAKWNAAEEYCKDRNYEWVIMTEDDIFTKFSF